MSERRHAIFDLDGTIVRGDTFVGHCLGYALRRPARWPGLALLAPLMAAYLLRLMKRDDFKRAFLRATLAGTSRDVLDAWSRRFAGRITVRPKARAAIDAHRARGDVLVLATASLDLSASVIAEVLGFDIVIATRTLWTPDGRLQAGFDGPNLKGEAKREAVAAHIGLEAARRAAAYSDELSDLPLLTLAAEGVLVTDRPRIRKAAERAGLKCLSWS